jgi:hypothetical protein
LDLAFDADFEDLDLVSDFLDWDEADDRCSSLLLFRFCDDPETLELSEVLLGLLLGLPIRFMFPS